MASLFDGIEDIPEVESHVYELLPDGYDDVSPVEAIMIVVLAIFGRADNRPQFYSDVRGIVLRCPFLKLPKLTNAVLKDAFDELLSGEIVFQYDGNFYLDPHYIIDVPQKALSNNIFESSVAQSLSVGHHWSMSMQQMRFCILTKRTSIGENKLRLTGYHGAFNVLMSLVLEQEDMSFVDLAFWQSVEPDGSGSLLEDVPHFLPPKDSVVQAAVDWFLTLSPKEKHSAFFSLISYLSLCGTPSHIDTLVADYLTVTRKHHLHVANIIFVADMMRGDLAQAREKADLFKVFWNDYNGNKRKHLPYALGGFYAILLFFSDEASESKMALTFLRASAKEFKDMESLQSMGSEFVELLLSYFMSKQNGNKIQFPSSFYTPDVAKVWINTILSWEGRTRGFLTLNPNVVQRCSRLELEMRACGQGFEGEGTEEVGLLLKSLSKRLEMKPLRQLIEPEPEWVEMLKVFEGMAGIKSTVASGPTERMLWRVDLDNEQIQPYYQKKQKAGWSKGRNIALRTIFSTTPTYASDVDVQIINNLKRRDGWYGVDYEWDYDKCLPLFVNHPLLFTMTEPMLPVELKEEEVMLIVKEKGGEIHISLSAEMDTTIVKESERRYKYLVWDKGVLQTARQMKNKDLKVLKFPKQAKDRAKSALTKFSQRVTVKGDFDDPNLIKKKSTNTALIRLQPVGEDLVATVLIKPLAKDELTLLPGVGAAQLLHRSAKGERIQISRNLNKEVEAIKKLKETIPTLRAMDDYEIAFDAEETILSFLSEMKDLAPKIELQWPKGETLRVAKVASLSDFNINVKSGVDWFEVNGKVQVDGEKVWSIQQMLEASAGGSKSFIKIDETTYVKLQKNLQKRLSELASIGQETSTGLQVHRLGASALGDIVDGAGKSRTDKGWKDNQKNILALRDFQPELPNNLHAELRPYQNEGYNWLSRLQAWGVGACLADDMGLGKTIQAIALMLKIADEGASLVIAPSSVCNNWHKEVQRFAPTLNRFC